MRSFGCAFCGLDSIGVCGQQTCGKAFCGRHGSAVGEHIYCADHRPRLSADWLEGDETTPAEARRTAAEARRATLVQLESLQISGHPGAEPVYAYRPPRRLLGSLWDRPLTRPRLERDAKWHGYHLGASHINGSAGDDAKTIVHWVFPSGQLVLPCHDTPPGWASYGPISVDRLDVGGDIDFDWLAAKAKLATSGRRS